MLNSNYTGEVELPRSGGCGKRLDGTRLSDEVLAQIRHSFSQQCAGSISRDKQHLDFRLPAGCETGEFRSVHHGHDDVGNHEIDLPRVGLSRMQASLPLAAQRTRYPIEERNSADAARTALSSSTTSKVPEPATTSGSEDGK